MDLCAGHIPHVKGHHSIVSTQYVKTEHFLNLSNHTQVQYVDKHGT